MTDNRLRVCFSELESSLAPVAVAGDLLAAKGEVIDLADDFGEDATGEPPLLDDIVMIVELN